METVEIVAIDPSLRFTGISKVSYNTETEKFKVSCCQVIKNKDSFKGTKAISYMLEQLSEAADDPDLLESEIVLVESPIMPFFSKFQGGAMISVAHIAGGAACLFGLDRVKLYRPSEWNRSKKKEVTHFDTQTILGTWETWGWKKSIKHKSQLEHVLDASSMALWYIKTNYIEKTT